MEELNHITQDLILTTFDEPFLLVFQTYYMPDGTDGGKILVFATTNDLRELFRSAVLLLDGTFKIKPHPFARIRGAQVFTLNTLVGDYPSTRMFRRALGILPSKSEHCYKTFLVKTLQAAVRDRQIDLTQPGSIRWKAVMCDFELGIHNALVDVATNILSLPDLALECCHMHFCSALIANIKTLGLSVAYATEASGLRHLVTKLFALAFLPADHIQEVFEYIVAEKQSDGMRASAQVQQFLNYFKNTYITNPNIPLECWSVFDRSDQSKRTSNDLEGKHR